MRCTFTLLILFFSSTAIAQSTDVLIHQADSCYQAKKYLCAAHLADQFLKLAPESDGLHYLAASYWAQAGNQEKAMQYLQRALTLGFGSRLEYQPELASLHQETEWPKLVQWAKRNYENPPVILTRKDSLIVGKLKRQQAIFEQKSIIPLIDFDQPAETLYQQLRNFNQYQAINAPNGYLFQWYPLNDSTSIPFTVRLPDNYQPTNKYSLLVVLHGAVAYNRLPKFPDSLATQNFNRYFHKYSLANNLITVYPYGNKQFNWMYPDDGFAIIPQIVSYLKRQLNIDDDRIFITGHSNGATGSFSYLMKAPNLFAGFYGVNTQPMVRTGGSFLKNARNRSFYNVATGKDYYYPPQANDSITWLATQLGISWKTDMYPDFPHWFPEFNESEPAIKKMFTNMQQIKRNPFGSELYWECDDVRYGGCDWIAITQLDTLQSSKAWHHTDNFTISKWIDEKNENKVLDTTALAFMFPRKSGAVTASFDDNTFRVNTSCVKEIKLFLSPEMVNFSKPVMVWLNGKRVWRGKLTYNKTLIRTNFEQDADRCAIWANELTIEVEEN